MVLDANRPNLTLNSCGRETVNVAFAIEPAEKFFVVGRILQARPK